jgi:hypothetical protein
VRAARRAIESPRAGRSNARLAAAPGRQGRRHGSVRCRRGAIFPLGSAPSAARSCGARLLAKVESAACCAMDGARRDASNAPRAPPGLVRGRRRRRREWHSARSAKSGPKRLKCVFRPPARATNE